LVCFSGGFRIAVDVPVNLDLQEPRLRLVQQFANIVEHRLTFLPDHKKVINLFEKNNKIQCYLKLLFVFNFQILTSHLKSGQLLDYTLTLRQFPSRSQSITRRPILHRLPHLNPDGSPLPTAHRKSPSPTTPMDSNRISNSNNRTILVCLKYISKYLIRIK